jgi:AAHS family benzoate transporter-like MFS transporter
MQPRRVLILAFLILFIDGFDMFSLGTVGPSLLAYQPWHVTPTVLGLLAAATGAGMPIGSTVAGWVSDRIGRRVPTVAALALISVAMLLAALAPGVTVFGAARVLTGIGIGALSPLMAATVADHAPAPRRTLYISVALAAFGVGGAASALAGWVLLPGVHFQRLFLIGVAPIVLLYPLWRLLPAHAPGRPDVAPRSAPRALFSTELRRSTILLWAASFLSLALIYSAGSWLPSVLLRNGYALSSALQFTIAFTLGASAGAVGLAQLADRGHLRPVTVGGFLLAASTLLVLPFVAGAPTVVLLLICALAGVGSLATQGLVVTCMVNAYPARLRGTGLGFGQGFGRLGAIAGPPYLAAATALVASPRAGFYAFAVLALLGGLAIAALPRRRAAPTPSTPVSVPTA